MPHDRSGDKKGKPPDFVVCIGRKEKTERTMEMVITGINDGKVSTDRMDLFVRLRPMPLMSLGISSLSKKEDAKPEDHGYAICTWEFDREGLLEIRVLEEVPIVDAIRKGELKGELHRRQSAEPTAVTESGKKREAKPVEVDRPENYHGVLTDEPDAIADWIFKNRDKNLFKKETPWVLKRLRN